MKELVTVIVPVYGAENYIERCAHSLFEQSYRNVEYIFINDGTPNNSIEVFLNVIKNYPERADNVGIIHRYKWWRIESSPNRLRKHELGWVCNTLWPR